MIIIFPRVFLNLYIKINCMRKYFSLRVGDILFEAVKDILSESDYEESKEEYIEFKELSKLPYEDLILLQKRVVENKKPWWQKAVNMFR